MKILTVTGKDFFGAGRAALRLHKGLCQKGVEARMYVGDKKSDDDTVVDIFPSYWQKQFIKLYRNLEDRLLKGYPNRHKGLFSSARYGMNPLRAIHKYQPDLVHFHWINRGLVKLDNLKKIKVPVVISLHDMWTFTGGCHYTGTCEAFKDGCGQCTFLSSGVVEDLSRDNYLKKTQVFNAVDNLTVIGLSKWMADEAKSSPLLNNARVVNLPNGIDIDKFSPKDNRDFKEKQGLSLDKKIVLFGAVAALDEPRKGFSYLKQALSLLDSNEYELVIIGGDKSFQQEGFKVHNLGNINDDELMIGFLSAADVVVVPSIQENLSNVIMESLACATPVVAFDIGGNGDMIKHQQNGYLSSLSSDELAEGIMWCASEENNAKLSEAARNYVVDNFDIAKVSQQYIALYDDILSNVTR